MSVSQYELIITIVNRGFANAVMDAAKSYGANGGTILYARGLGEYEATKFIGISIQPEKEMVLILTDSKKKHDIMKGISNNVGISTPGKGISFSLPVSAVVGLNFEMEDK